MMNMSRGQFINTENSNQDYMDGSIYRVKLHDFLTYNNAEFFPGPRLNVVLGPNGTGKSSIVCALCIGLAGSTKLLGRADKVGHFVRHQKDSAFTEIELYFKSGNIIIRRDIFREGNSSRWKINGRGSTEHKVKELMKKHRIQIDNLCQFLPQDKVGDFSQMNPQQLLRATESAIFSNDLADAHDQILKLQRDHKTNQRDYEGAKAAYDLKVLANEHRARDVERLEEHRKRMRDTELMEKKLLWAKVEVQQHEVNRLKQIKNELKGEYLKMRQHQLEPIKARSEEVEAEFMDVQARNGTKKKQKMKTEDTLKRQSEQIEKYEGEQQQVRNELDQLRNSRKHMQKKLDSEKEKLRSNQTTREGLASVEDLKQEKIQYDEQCRAIDAEIEAIQPRLHENHHELKSIQTNLHRLHHQIKKLDDKSIQRENAMMRKDESVMKVRHYLKENKFGRRKIWGPVGLEINVEDPLHAKYLENTISTDVMLALVTECREDYNAVLNKFRDMRLSLRNVEGGVTKTIQRPFSEAQWAELRSTYKFECYLDEVVRVPDVILEVLGIENLIVGSKETENFINRGNGLNQMMNQCIELSGQSTIVLLTPSKRYVGIKSRYGGRQITIQTSDLKEASLLVASAADEDERQQIDFQVESNQAQEAALKQKIEEGRNEERALMQQKEEVRRSSFGIREAIKQINRLDREILISKNEIKGLERKIGRDVSEEENAIARKAKNKLSKYVQAIQQRLSTSNRHFEDTLDFSMAQINITSYKSMSDAANKHLRRVQSMLKEVQEQITNTRENIKEAGGHAKALQRQAQTAAPLDEYAELFQDLPDTIGELDSRIKNNKATMEHFRGDMSAIEEYESCKEQINRERLRLESLLNSLENADTEIESIKGPWHAELKTLVTQINASFSKYFKEIGCVGEVALNDSSDNISDWGIERRVQFRENSQLTVMNAQEQSGGEKSVGTIMYMMALQSLTNCPFRVVDEINQGMDAENERKVFRRITSSSCGDFLPQYFLITPKLITGLQYHRDVKVLFILNGCWSIPQKEWKMTKFLQQQAPRGAPPAKRVKAQ